MFSVEHEGKTVVVLYHGLCLVSAEDRLLIRGKWYQPTFGSKHILTSKYT